MEKIWGVEYANKLKNLVVFCSRRTKKNLLTAVFAAIAAVRAVVAIHMLTTATNPYPNRFD